MVFEIKYKHVSAATQSFGYFQNFFQRQRNTARTTCSGVDIRAIFCKRLRDIIMLLLLYLFCPIVCSPSASLLKDAVNTVLGHHLALPWSRLDFMEWDHVNQQTLSLDGQFATGDNPVWRMRLFAARRSAHSYHANYCKWPRLSCSAYRA